MYHISPTNEIKRSCIATNGQAATTIGSQEEYQQPGPLGNNILNQSDMQSTEAQGARARTSTSRTSSTRSTRDQIPHIAITISGMDCTFAKETQPLTNVATQTWTLSPTTHQTSRQHTNLPAQRGKDTIPNSLSRSKIPRTIRPNSPALHIWKSHNTTRRRKLEDKKVTSAGLNSL